MDKLYPYETIEYRKLLSEWRHNPPVEANITKDYEAALAIAQIMAADGENQHRQQLLDQHMMRVSAFVEVFGRIPNAD